MTPRWRDVCALEEVPAGTSKVVKRDGKHVAIFHLSRGSILAVDNRCPHEGYPLAQGWVKDCVITCAWHNYKFDLRDGRCVMGEEDVAAYPLRVNAGRIEVDTQDPDPDLMRARLEPSLTTALLERRMGQAARDITRLLSGGVDATQIAIMIAKFDAARSEYGTTHALPVAVDALGYLAHRSGAQVVLPLMQAADLASEAHVRRPARALVSPRHPGGDPVQAGEDLREMVEAEEGAMAEALLLGALEHGWARAEIEPWFFHLSADHFLDFGHALIYQIKMFDLLERAGWSHAAGLLPALMFRIVNGTREDLLPDWKPFASRVDLLRPNFAEWRAQQRNLDCESVRDATLDGDLDQLVGSIGAAFEAGASPESVVDALLVAASERLLRFDLAVDRDPGIQHGWLDVTHLLTFAHAARDALERFASPRALELVFQAARFIHRAQPLDLAPGDRPRPEVTSAATVSAVLEAVAIQDTPTALDLTATLLAGDAEVDELRRRLLERALEDVATRPIVVGHLIKTTVAAFEARARMSGHAGRDRPVLGLIRFLASPVQERRIARATHEALRFVIEGRPPKTLY